MWVKILVFSFLAKNEKLHNSNYFFSEKTKELFCFSATIAKYSLFAFSVIKIFVSNSFLLILIKKKKIFFFTTNYFDIDRKIINK